MHKKGKPNVEGEPDVRTDQSFVEGNNVEGEGIIIEGREEPPSEAEPNVIDGPDQSNVGTGVRTYLGIAAVAAVVGFASGFFTGGEVKHYHGQIKALYVGKLNDDSHQDFAFKKRNGRTLIYLGHEDGSYRKLENVQAEIIERARNHIRGIRERAEENLRDVVE